MSTYVSNKENIYPYNTPSFAKKAAKKALLNRAGTNSNNYYNNHNSNNMDNKQRSQFQNRLNMSRIQPNHIDKVVESVANATKRLSQQSAQSSSSKKKTENRVGPWRLGRTLGKGSTGRVRLAKHIQTGKLAAIKIIPKTFIDDSIGNDSVNNRGKQKKKQKFDENGLPYGIEREIIIMKLISHPNIMALYDVWENKDELYLVLEYVEGGELFDFLINNGRLSERDAISYFRMIISGVSYCHKFNICHRDLKPENILLDRYGRIKIADFGMAALETKQKLLETSCGSPHYASPEIVAGKNYHGSPSDVWSCGVILFALLTGHLPFDDPNIRNLLLKVQTGKFHMPSSLSNEAKDLIWSMLRVDPNQRIQIQDIFNHPLMLKYYPLDVEYNDSNQIENQLNHLDISKPIKDIDEDILSNLQTLWHGLPEDHLIHSLQNDENNPEKMFYYLLENYKLTHMDDLDSQPPSLTHSISQTAIPLKPKNTIPRSTSTVITTIQDEDGKVLKSEVQEIKPMKNSSSKDLKGKLKKKTSQSKIVASTSYNKSISFRMKRDSTLSIINMNRNLGIKNDASIKNLAVRLQNSPIEGEHDENHPKRGSTEEISNSKSFTVNPKDLPELPDIKEYRYLMQLFDGEPSNYKQQNELKNPVLSSSSSSSQQRQALQPKAEDDIDILDIANSSFSEEATNKTINTSIDSKSVTIDPPRSDDSISKLEQLKKDLGISNRSNNSLMIRNFSGLRSVGSSSTRRLNTFLSDEYKDIKLKDLNKKERKLDVSCVGHTAQKSMDSKFSQGTSDLAYSIHSAIEVRMITPTESEIRKLNDGKVFEDADESNLISDDSIIKTSTNRIKLNILPNVDYHRKSIRNSMITTTSEDSRDRITNVLVSRFQDAPELEPLVPPPNSNSNSNSSLKSNSNFNSNSNSNSNNNNSNDTLESGVCESLYTTLEEQPENKHLANGIFDKTPIKEEDVCNSNHTNDVPPISQKTTEEAVEKVIEEPTKRPTKKSVPKSHGKQIKTTESSRTKKKNWFQRITSAFSSKSPTSSTTNSSTSNFKFQSLFTSKARETGGKKRKFSLNFRKPKYTPRSRGVGSEYMIESDTVTKNELLKCIREDPRTKILKLTDMVENGGGFEYVYDIPNLKTKLGVNVIEKIGSEYGFGGCFVKLVKLEMAEKSFNYWCEIFKILIKELESEVPSD